MFDISPNEHQTALHTFFAEHAEALQYAALLLGGRTWLRRTQRLIDDLGKPTPLTRRTRDELRKVHGLLTLQYVSDLDGPEWHHFAKIDPAQPEIEEVCLLTEGLERAAAGANVHLCPFPTDHEVGEVAKW